MNFNGVLLGNRGILVEFTISLGVFGSVLEHTVGISFGTSRRSWLPG